MKKCKKKLQVDGESELECRSDFRAWATCNYNEWENLHEEVTFARRHRSLR